MASADEARVARAAGKMRRLYYILVFLIALMVLDATANNARYTRPYIDIVGRSAQRFTHAIGNFVDDIFRWAHR